MSELVTLEASYAIAESPHSMGPLSVLLSPSGHYSVEAGETFEISLTVDNQGPQGAVIDVYLDETSKAVCQWCLNPYERLALEPSHSSEVRFKVTIPVQTLPGTYDYLIVVDAPDHYPEDTPLRYPATIQVLPPVKSAVNLNDATFATRPETSSDHPATLEPGTPLEVQVIVHNRSNRVDQFRLEITDLPEDWYRIMYPEGLGELGLIVDTDYLALNPGVKGLIRWVITCPATTLAGRYLATLRLRSANEPDLVLMDMLYFEVPAVYDLTVKAEAIIRNVKQQAALVHLHVTNAGNTAREIALQIQEDREDPLFHYQIDPAHLRVSSMTTAKAVVTASPATRWRRAWIGRGRQITFRTVVSDRHALPLPEATTAELLWERRPWWHMALVLLLATGVVGTVLGILWWLFLRPPAPPRVINFGATTSTYYQQRNDFVHLTWQIENARQIQTLELRGSADQGATAPQPITYDFSEGLPPELSEYCVLEKTLSCSNILTSARQPGSYQFALTVLPKNDKAASIVAETPDIQVLPTPPPKIRTFAATQPRYWEGLDVSLLKSDTPSKNQSSQEQTSPKPTANVVALNWQVTFSEPISHLTLVGRLAEGEPLSSPQKYDLTDGLPPALEDFCTLTDTDLTCRALPTNAQTVGTYVFELNVFTPDGMDPIATAETEPVRIVPAPVRIESFTVNGEAAPAKYQVSLPLPTDDSEPTIRLAWRVVGGPYTQVEILPTPGSVPLAGTLDYPLTANTREVITLQVTSVSGEQITRSVTLEPSQPAIRLPLSPQTASSEMTLTIPPPPAPEENALEAEVTPSPAEASEPIAPTPSNPLAKPAIAPAPTKPETGSPPGGLPSK